jgi:threonine/homoserine/homoserine lactone efflux protein
MTSGLNVRHKDVRDTNADGGNGPMWWQGRRRHPKGFAGNAVLPDGNGKMTSSLTILMTGMLLGLSGGLMPGPLLTLVVAETLRHGIRGGVKVSLAPLVTDAPIILLTITVLKQLADIDAVYGVIALCGAAVLLYFGIESLRFQGSDLQFDPINPQSFRKGILANILNPSPYIFWMSIGAPLVLKAAKIQLLMAVLFIAGFYLLLVGSKIVVAVLVGKSRRFLKSAYYVFAIRVLGLFLIGFAVVFVRDGLSFWGLL